MRIGLIGLGRMGGNIVRRAMRGGHECVAYDRDPEAVAKLVGDGAVGAAGLQDLVGKLPQPRVVWLMLPAGEITEQTVTDIAKYLQPGDYLIDGGNGYYKDDIRRYKALKALGVNYIDIGASGGIWGWERGYCMMVGGDSEAGALHRSSVDNSGPRHGLDNADPPAR